MRDFEIGIGILSAVIFLACLLYVLPVAMYCSATDNVPDICGPSASK